MLESSLSRFYMTGLWFNSNYLITQQLIIQHHFMISIFSLIFRFANAFEMKLLKLSIYTSLERFFYYRLEINCRYIFSVFILRPTIIIEFLDMPNFRVFIFERMHQMAVRSQDRDSQDPKHLILHTRSKFGL